MEKETISEGIVNLVRGLTRPFLAFTGLFSWIMLFANGYDIPAFFTGLVYGMVVYYFGDRTFFKIKGLKK